MNCPDIARLFGLIAAAAPPVSSEIPISGSPDQESLAPTKPLALFMQLSKKMSEALNPLKVSTTGDPGREATRLIRSGAFPLDDLKTEYPAWGPVIHFAAQRNLVEIVECLIDYGLEVDQRDGREWTPLHFAADCGALATVKLLISKGADVNARRDNYDTPLTIAARNGHVEVMEYLLAKGADARVRLGDYRNTAVVGAPVATQKVLKSHLRKLPKLESVATEGLPVEGRFQKKGVLTFMNECKRAGHGWLILGVSSVDPYTLLRKVGNHLGLTQPLHDARTTPPAPMVRAWAIDVGWTLLILSLEQPASEMAAKASEHAALIAVELNTETFVFAGYCDPDKEYAEFFPPPAKSLAESEGEKKRSDAALTIARSTMKPKLYEKLMSTHAREHSQNLANISSLKYETAEPASRAKKILSEMKEAFRLRHIEVPPVRQLNEGGKCTLVVLGEKSPPSMFVGMLLSE